MEEGRGGTPQMCENVQGEGVFQEYTSAYFFLK